MERIRFLEQRITMLEKTIERMDASLSAVNHRTIANSTRLDKLTSDFSVSELKNCPFCGSDEVEFETWQPGIVNLYRVHCGYCGFRTDYFGDPYGNDASSKKNREIAISAWNRRV